MTEHLPECPSGQRKWQRAEAPIYGAMCICRELSIAHERGLEVGYQRGMAAARDAEGYSPTATDNRP